MTDDEIVVLWRQHKEVMSFAKALLSAERERLAQQKQEPVVKWDASAPLVVTPHPAFQVTQQRREWVGLTEEDFSAINQSCLTKLQAATSAESILKGKNNG